MVEIVIQIIYIPLCPFCYLCRNYKRGEEHMKPALIHGIMSCGRFTSVAYMFCV